MRVQLFPAGESVCTLVTLDPMHDEEFTKMQQEGFATQLDERFGAGAGG